MRDAAPGRVLVAYALLDWPLRKTVEDHLYSLDRYGRGRYHYVNVAIPGLARAYSRARWDAIVWHTSVLAWLRWAPSDQLRGLLRRVRSFQGQSAFSVALPQDEFLRSTQINAFLREAGVNHVFSVSPPSEWPKIYDGLDPERTRISRVLTGYLDPDTLARIDAILARRSPRKIDIGYRAAAAKPYLGRHAMLKTEIGEQIRARAEQRGLTVDISTEPKDTIFGDDWYRFLASCRYTIGMEGGASILDTDGSVREATEAYQASHPGATFEELEANCFPGRDGELSLFAISPRHLEATATRTAQILVEGDYNGILTPGQHYLALRPDLSNLDEVLDVVKTDRERAWELAEAAHADVVASGRWTYERLVGDIEQVLPPGQSGGAAARTSLQVGRTVDRATRPLLPLAVRGLMPIRRRVLGYLPRSSARPVRAHEAGQTRGPGDGSGSVDGVLVLYHRAVAPWYRDASTVEEHLGALRRHASLPVWELNTDLAFPFALESLSFRAIVLHYSLFDTSGSFHLSGRWKDYVKQTSAYKLVFFQDEYLACQARFAFLNEQEIDCLYTCLDAQDFEKVYGRYTHVPRIESNLPGYVDDDLVVAGQRFQRPDAERTVDVGYRGRPLPAYLGRGAMEKHEIGERFKELASGRGLALDIAGDEGDRLYGDDWYRFLASCRCVLGVESGATAFDLEGEIMAEYRDIAARQESTSVEDLRTLRRWDGLVECRTISPRHFEAAALRACQILFEGRYSGALKPMIHYIPLRKDFSNFEEVMALAQNAELRRELTENAYRDLIASGTWSYARFMGDVEHTIREETRPPVDASTATEVDALLGRHAAMRTLRRKGQYLLRAVPEKILPQSLIQLLSPVASRLRRSRRGLDGRS